MTCAGRTVLRTLPTCELPLPDPPDTTMDEFTAKLDSFDRAERQDALENLRADMTRRDGLSPQHVNMHCHTFYSYNGYGASPCHVAWEAMNRGLSAAGICDFDVLDALDEFLWASDTLGLRATVNIETRVFFSEYADHVINSPGEPGIYYFMGGGFVRQPAPGSPAAAQLAAMRAGAESRNREVVDKVNAHTGVVRLDYDADVVSLTPAGNATERHICSAYYARSSAHFGGQTPQAAAYWAKCLDVDADIAAKALADPMAFNDLARSKLMKTGGPGYVAPTRSTFPALEDVIAFIQACDAVPMGTWLDSMNSGERDMKAQLECLKAKGVAALNIIPDRNWNIKDPGEKAVKVAKLHDVVRIADSLHLPLNVGTELNKYGQKWVDDFTAEPMQPVVASFIRGAYIMVGHTRLLRYAGISLCGPEIAAEFGTNLRARNDAFEAIGKLPPLSIRMAEEYKGLEPDDVYSRMRDAGKVGHW